MRNTQLRPSSTSRDICHPSIDMPTHGHKTGLFSYVQIRVGARPTSLGSTGTPSDAPPRVTYIHPHQLLQGPVEGESRRAHLVRTASGYDLPSPAISPGRPIVFGFFPQSFYEGLGMVHYLLLQKHLGTIPSI